MNSFICTFESCASYYMKIVPQFVNKKQSTLELALKLHLELEDLLRFICQ